MQDMKKLAQLLKQIEDQLVVCMRCGMCQSVCPVFAETGRESDVARGKLALLDGLLQEMFTDPDGVQERLLRCLLCGSCAANCPSGVKVLDIFIKARAIITSYKGLSPVKKIIFRKMLARPQLFDQLMEWGSKLQGIFIKPVDELLGTSCARFVSPLGDRHFSSLAPKSFHRMVPYLNTPAGVSGMKVGFFVGCVIDKVFPKIAQTVLHAMKHHGVGVFIPKDAGCCGIPALSSGDTDTFNNLVRYNLKIFSAEKFDVLVTACATCTSTIKKLWPTLAEDLSSQELDRVKDLADRTMDISQFLVEKLGIMEAVRTGNKEKTRITYHDPCHLKKSLGIATQPRTVIKANPAYEFMEMKEADQCCGCGGSFNLQHYDLSSAIGKHKRDNIVDSGCSVVATSCPACMLQISDMLSQAGDRVKVKHAVEIYAESLGKV
jgi:glycolate oxidase iron-sulfur subunit